MSDEQKKEYVLWRCGECGHEMLEPPGRKPMSDIGGVFKQTRLSYKDNQCECPMCCGEMRIAEDPQ